VIIFLFYAAIVWYCCFKWRRHWLGFASVAAGLALVALSSLALASIERYLIRTGSAKTMDARLFHMLLGVEAAIVGVVGIFFACLPRESPQRPCRRCGYELKGLETSNPTCPECGLSNAAARVRTIRCSLCSERRPIASPGDVCESCVQSRAARAIPGPEPSPAE